VSEQNTAISDGSGDFEDRVFAEAERSRSKHELVRTTLERAYEFIAPERLPEYLGVNADEMYANVYDSTAIDEIDNLSNTFVTGMVPSWFPWCKLGPGPLVQGDDRYELQNLLDDANRILLLFINLSNFYDVIPGFFTDYIMGTATIKIEPRSDGNGFQFTDMLADQVAIEESASKQVSHHYVVHLVPAWEILANDEWMKKIRASKAASEVESMLKEQKSKGIETLEVNVPMRDGGNFHALYLRKPCIQLEHREQSRNPYTTARWGRLQNTPYGSGRGIRAFPDVRTLNKFTEMVMESTALSVAPIYTGRHDSIFNPYNAVFNSGTVIPVLDNRDDNPTLRELERSAQLTPGIIVLRDLQQKVKGHFYGDDLTPTLTTPKSATEIAEASVQKLTRIGGVHTRVDKEGITPLTVKMVDILIKQGHLPKVAQVDRRIIDITITSQIAQAQRRSEIRDMLQFLQTVGSVVPLDRTAAMLPNVRQIVRDVGEILNIRADRTRNDGEIDRMVRQAAEATLALSQPQGAPGEQPAVQ